MEPNIEKLIARGLQEYLVQILGKQMTMWGGDLRDSYRSNGICGSIFWIFSKKARRVGYRQRQF